MMLLRHCCCTERSGRRSSAAFLQKLYLSGGLSRTIQAGGHRRRTASLTARLDHAVKLLRAAAGDAMGRGRSTCQCGHVAKTQRGGRVE